MVKSHCKLLSLAAIGVIFFAVVGAASAQSGSQVKASAGSGEGDPLTASAMAQFSQAWGIPVEQSSAALPPAPIDGAPPTNRLRELQRLASAGDRTWRKIYRVSPAAPGLPVTTGVDARRMADQTGTVTLSLTGSSAVAAIDSVAAADNAAVAFEGFLPRSSVDLNLTGATVADAIATIAQRTHTHWQAVYQLGPPLGARPAPGRVAVGPKPMMTYQQYEATQLFNGPTTIHVSATNVNTAPAPVNAPGSNGFTDNGAYGAGSGQAVGAPGLAPLGPSAAQAARAYGYTGYPYGSQYPYGNSPYPTGGMMQGEYSPFGFGQSYSVTPGFSVQSTPNPYAGSTLVFGGSAVNSF